MEKEINKSKDANQIDQSSYAEGLESKQLIDSGDTNKQEILTKNNLLYNKKILLFFIIVLLGGLNIFQYWKTKSVVSQTLSDVYTSNKNKCVSVNVHDWYSCLKAEGTTIKDDVPVVCIDNDGTEYIQSSSTAFDSETSKCNDDWKVYRHEKRNDDVEVLNQFKEILSINEGIQNPDKLFAGENEPVEIIIKDSRKNPGVGEDTVVVDMEELYTFYVKNNMQNYIDLGYVGTRIEAYFIDDRDQWWKIKKCMPPSFPTSGETSSISLDGKISPGSQVEFSWDINANCLQDNSYELIEGKYAVGLNMSINNYKNIFVYRLVWISN